MIYNSKHGHTSQGRLLMINSILEFKQASMKRVREQIPQYKEECESVFKALRWAKLTLMHMEGSGHDIHLHREEKGYYCSFAKPSWSGDHCGDYYKTGAEAVVGAVLEYQFGL